jgi:hypothetical protein
MLQSQKLYSVEIWDDYHICCLDKYLESDDNGPFRGTSQVFQKKFWKNGKKSSVRIAQIQRGKLTNRSPYYDFYNFLDTNYELGKTWWEETVE